MPEGVEVALFGEKLNKNIKGKVLKNINVLSGRYTKNKIENFNYFLSEKPLIVEEVKTKGKFIYWLTNKDLVFFNTLGMTGSWSTTPRKHARIEFNFEEKSLYYNDIRNFGTFSIKNKEDLSRKLDSLGPDMLFSEKINFVGIMRKHNKKNICKVLMSQNIISGIGNYIKAESLWLSRVNPHSKVEEIPDFLLLNLEKCIRHVMKKSYKMQGASIQSYYNFDNQEGKATNFFNVYGKKTDSLGNLIIKEQTADKRSTYWVKEVQIYGR